MSYRQGPETLSAEQSLFLDGLRYLAALMVALHHGLGYFYGASYRVISQAGFFTNLGSMGVAMFFVLSGFVITYTAITKRARDSSYDFRSFAIERCARIYLVFLPAMALAVLVNLINLAVIRDNIGGAANFTVLNPLITLSMLAGIVNRHAEIMPLIGPAWSINYEFWFYGLLGFFALPIGGMKPIASWILRIAGFAAIAALIRDMQLLKPLGGLWLFGAVCGLVFTSRTRAKWFGLLGLGAVTWLLRSDIESAVLALSLPAGLMLFSLVRLQSHFAWVREAASFSYSLYLTHVIVIWACRHFSLVTGLYEYGSHDWRKAIAFSATMIAANLFAFAFAYVTERHTNAVRAWILNGFRNPKSSGVPAASLTPCSVLPPDRPPRSS